MVHRRGEHRVCRRRQQTRNTVQSQRPRAHRGFPRVSHMRVALPCRDRPNWLHGSARSSWVRLFTPPFMTTVPPTVGSTFTTSHTCGGRQHGHKTCACRVAHEPQMRRESQLVGCLIQNKQTPPLPYPALIVRVLPSIPPTTLAMYLVTKCWEAEVAIDRYRGQGD